MWRHRAWWWSNRVAFLALVLGGLSQARAQTPPREGLDAGALDAGALDAGSDDLGDAGVDDVSEVGNAARDAGPSDPRSCAPGWTHRGPGGVCIPRPDDPDVDGGPALGTLPPRPYGVAVGAGRVVFPGAVFRVGSRTVSVGPFALGRSEVTVGQYGQCVAAGRCVAPPDPTGQMALPAHRDHPVVNVTHAMAVQYCVWSGARLPTAAEHILAAGGVEGRRFPWGSRAADCVLATMAGCSPGPQRVGFRAAGATPEGVLDLAGNVAEWTADRPGVGGRPSVGTTVTRDPEGGRGGTMRVVRGGSFRSGPRELESAASEAVHEAEARVDLGFRCAQGL